MQSALEILALLDSVMTDARGDVPPPPDIYNVNFQFVEGRLSVFRGDTLWALAFEFVCYTPGTGAYTHSLHLYGNRIAGNVLWNLRELPVQINLDDLWDGDKFLAHRYHPKLYWNEQSIEIQATPEEYSTAGILFPPSRQDTNDMTPLELLAYLCWKFRSPFFLDEESLMQVVRDATEESGDLHLVFQTTRWQHPDFSEGERPSDLPGIRLLAQLIAEGDSSVWHAFDPRWVNTTYTQVVQRNWEFLYPFENMPSDGGAVGLYSLVPLAEMEFAGVDETSADTPDEKHGD